MTRIMKWLATFVSAMVAAALPAQAAPPAAEVEAGRRAFVRCVACHTLDAQGSQRFGPHLAGIVGRRAASVPDYPYTPLMHSQEFTWTRKRLDRWLKQPQKMLGDVCLPFTGLESAKERRALIAYLENGVP